jgi:hypothetical protein
LILPQIGFSGEVRLGLLVESPAVPSGALYTKWAKVEELGE